MAKKLSTIPVAYTVDPVSWARCQVYTVGRACTLCANEPINEFCTAIVKEWASTRVKPWNLSWPKIALKVRDMFGTRTHWISIRNHYRDHNPALYRKLERRRRGA